MPPAQPSNSSKDDPPGPPSAPRIFGISSSITPLEEIEEIMIGLGDGKMLSQARKHFSPFNYSIYRWALLRHQMARTNVVTFTKAVVVIPTGEASSDPTFIQDFLKDEIRNHLTVNNIRRLALYDPPGLSDFDREKGAITPFSLPSAQIPLTPTMASTLVEAGLILSLLYFWLYQQEAQSSKSFPAAGTLFGAISRSVGARILFVTLIAVPLVTAMFLAIKLPTDYSYFLLNYVLAGAVLIAAITVGLSSRLLRR
jgi:hypothetical protein